MPKNLIFDQEYSDLRQFLQRIASDPDMTDFSGMLGHFQGLERLVDNYALVRSKVSVVDLFSRIFLCIFGST